MFGTGRCGCCATNATSGNCPGGKLELGENPVDCLRREIAEETGWAVTVGPILDAWQYHIHDGVDVLIVTYGCFVDTHEPCPGEP